ncbi:MAG: hypothetical protein HS115_00195 [Spirochaetales bacterium]|nr:hypothetical protein [Spirochaetales bacterium]
MNHPGYRLRAPAKINLGLEIFHRSPGGKHYLASIFLPVSLADELIFRPAEEDGLSTVNLLDGPARQSFAAVSEGGSIQNNLVHRALQLTQPYRTERFQIELHKVIPTGGGLGGGSSDAGCTLRFLRPYLNCSESALDGLALSLGSDVPFFLKPEPALIHGLGERRTTIEIGPGLGMLCLPDIHMGTAEAFSSLKRPLHPAPPPESLQSLTESVRQALRKSDWARVQGLRNDFEPIVFELHPRLALVKDRMVQAGAAFASLSGSGSALYGLFAAGFDVGALCRQFGAWFPTFKFIEFNF